MKKQAGMTLIELVIVIIVLGIIAAVAAPRFVDISTNAMTAGVDGSIGAFRSALTITRAEQQDARPTWAQIESNLEGFSTAPADTPAAADGTITIDLDSDATVDLTITGYSDADCTTAHVAENVATLSWGDGTNCVNM